MSGFIALCIRTSAEPQDRLKRSLWPLPERSRGWSDANILGRLD
jgi:hypothetical protein